MHLLQPEKKSPPTPCHYIKNKYWRFRYFFASDLSSEELLSFLSKGWRKFGYYYFMPDCDDCHACTPIRIKVNDFKPSKSHRRIINRNKNIRVRFEPLNYSEKIFEIYEKHSMVRFNQSDTDKSDFQTSFFTRSCPTFLSKYYYEEMLIGVGFLDRCTTGLSSIYFIFDTDYSKFNLGTFSILTEINHTANQNMSDYYLGYYIRECSSMAYKGKFQPYELYSWQNKTWVTPETFFNQA